MMRKFSLRLMRNNTLNSWGLLTEVPLSHFLYWSEQKLIGSDRSPSSRSSSAADLYLKNTSSLFPLLTFYPCWTLTEGMRHCFPNHLSSFRIICFQKNFLVLLPSGCYLYKWWGKLNSRHRFLLCFTAFIEQVLGVQNLSWGSLQGWIMRQWAPGHRQTGGPTTCTP